VAVGTYSIVVGRWQDNSTNACKPCPSADPAVVVCNENKAVSQPGYFSVYAVGPRRTEGYNTVKVHSPVALNDRVCGQVVECPNSNACKYTGLIDAACNTLLEACNNNITLTDLKCDEGYTGVSAHTNVGTSRNWDSNFQP